VTTMNEGDDSMQDWVSATWRLAQVERHPFLHWLLNHALPYETACAIANLPVPAPEIGDSLGKRETHNSTRWFFSPQNQVAYPQCGTVARAFQNPRVTQMLESLTGTRLAGTFLRIEYCQDLDGFWLEPHTDIGAKRFTALIYLSQLPEAEMLGTDLYDAQRKHLGTASGGFDKALIFIPGADTWHGFRRRSFAGVRKSIIVNYVGQEWRARHELAFPDEPVR